MRFHEAMLSVCMNDLTDINIKSSLISSTVRLSEQAMHVAMLDSQAERPVFVRFVKTAGNLCDSQKSEVVAQNQRFVRHLIRKFVCAQSKRRHRRSKNGFRWSRFPRSSRMLQICQKNRNQLIGFFFH